MTPEPDVRTFAAHLTARFVENGVPADDLNATVERIGHWSQWCAEWERSAADNLRRADAAQEAGATLTAAELRLVAALEYHFGKFLFVHDQEALSRATASTAVTYRRASEHLPWPGRPLPVMFEGRELAGVLRLPDRPAGQVPAVIVVPGLDATKEEMHRFTEVFLRRGMATFTFDGPGQGETEQLMPLRPDWEKVAAAALDTLAARPEVNQDKIAAVGVSLGGYFVARAAAAEPRLSAVACVGGCFSLAESWPSLAPLSRAAFRARAGADDEEHARRLAGAFSLEGIRPEGGAPVLVIHGARDRLFEPSQAAAVARLFGRRAALVIEERGNHVLHNLAYRVRPAIADWVAAQLA